MRIDLRTLDFEPLDVVARSIHDQRVRRTPDRCAIATTHKAHLLDQRIHIVCEPLPCDRLPFMPPVGKLVADKLLWIIAHAFPRQLAHIAERRLGWLARGS